MAELARKLDAALPEPRPAGPPVPGRGPVRGAAHQMADRFDKAGHRLENRAAPRAGASPGLAHPSTHLDDRSLAAGKTPVGEPVAQGKRMLQRFGDGTSMLSREVGEGKVRRDFFDADGKLLRIETEHRKGWTDPRNEVPRSQTHLHIVEPGKPDVDIWRVRAGDNFGEITHVGGNISSVEFDLRADFGGGNRPSAENAASARVGKSGLLGDEGGHGVAYRFLLDQNRKNLFPQNRNFNRGAYKTMENDIALVAKAGGRVTGRIDFDPGKVPQSRPSAIIANVKFENQGESFGRGPSFQNGPGQSYRKLTPDELRRLGVR